MCPIYAIYMYICIHIHENCLLKENMYKYIYIYMYSMEFYSVKRMNDTRWFKGEWMKLEDIMLSEVSQIQKDKSGCFLSFVEDRSKRQTYMQKL
jgi:hypothetical protein